MFVRILLIVGTVVVALAVLARPSDSAGRERTYVVRAGDSLWSIAAAQYAGDPREGVWRLERRNHLTGGALAPGQRLVLPG